MKFLCWLGYHAKWVYEVAHAWHNMGTCDRCGVEKGMTRTCPRCGKREIIYHFLDRCEWFDMNKEISK